MNGFIALWPIPEGRGAASCRPLRSWPLGRRSGRVPALPYPPPRYRQCISSHCDQANSFSLVLAGHVVMPVAGFCLLFAQVASTPARVDCS